MKKILLTYLQSCPLFSRANFVQNTFLLFGIFIVSFTGIAQQEDHDINAGPDVTLDCGEECTDLTASYLYTGQTDQYSVSSIPYEPPFPYTGLANPVSVGIDDVWSPVINLPFEFCFYGELYTQAQVGSNGIVSFNSHSPGGHCSYTLGANEYIPGGVTHKNAIMLFHDINPRYGTNEIGWELLGQAPYRTLVVSFYNVPYYNSSNPNNSATSTFQMVLYETTNAIEIYIESKPDPHTVLTSPINGGRAVMGIQDATGTKGETAPGRNTGVWSATNEAWRFTPNGDPNVEFAWLDDAGNVISTDTTINVCPDEGETTYTAQAIYLNCNGAEVTVTDEVTVTKINSDFDITLDLGPDKNFCDTPSYEIVPEIEGDTTGATYLWSPGGETTPTITVTDSGTYSLEITLGSCSVTDSVDILFLESPDCSISPDCDTTTLPVVVTPSDMTDCVPAGNTGTFNLEDQIAEILNGQNPNLFIISFHHTQLDAESNMNPIQNPTDYENVSNPETIYVRVENAGESTCFSTVSFELSLEDGIEITVDLPSDIDVCSTGSFPELDATPTNENIDLTLVTYEWKDANGNIVSTDATYTPTEGGAHTVEVSYPPCSVEVFTINVNVTTAPDLDLGPDQSLCGGESFEIVPTITGDTTDITYSWSTGETTPTITVTESGIYTLDITVGPCTVSDSVEIMLADPINVDLGGDISSCFDENIVLTATVEGDSQNMNYEWYMNGTLLSGETSSTLIIDEVGEYKVVVTNADGCTGEDTIMVSPGDDISVTLGDDFEICPNEPHTITATISEEDATYQWFLNGTEISGETNSTLDISINPGTMGSQTYSVVVTASGCTGTDAVDVRLYSIGNCVISQGISPNGDGYNDALDLSFLNDRTGIKKLQIFNRLGTLVYEKVNYINEWEGQTKDGNDLPTGTYFYVIDLNGNDAVYGEQHTGWIYLNQEAN